MDTRLFKIAGRRLAKLRKQDLPEVAEALLDAFEGRATISALRRMDVSFVWIRGPQTNQTILKEDWVLIEPFVKDGSWTSFVNVTEAPAGRLRRGASFRDNSLYVRILGQLQILFTDEWPTSSI